jgi:F-type H+-transporting ATPase subunit epsilon
MALQVSVVTPEREVWSGESSFVVARAEGGEIGVLPGHAPFLGSLHHAVLKIEHADGVTLFAVHGGFIEVYENRVTVLAPLAETSDEIDVDRARRDLEEAEAALGRAGDEDADEHRQAFLRAQARLKTAAEAGLIVG